MNDACSTMVKRINEMLPSLEDNTILQETMLKQDVSGNEGNIFELELGRFTQSELTVVFEMIVASYTLKTLEDKFQ